MFFSVLFLMMFVVLLGTASAFGGNFFGMEPESREDIVNAIEAKDYEAWKEAMSSRLTEDNFNKRVERHEAMSEMREQRQTMNQAVEDGDYEAWKEAAENSPMISKIQSVDDFEILVQIYQAKQDGDYEKAKELNEQLGFPCGFGEHKMDRHFEDEG
jgi:hypothetical protein